jgi:hypothetical protein
MYPAKFMKWLTVGMLSVAVNWLALAQDTATASKEKAPSSESDMMATMMELMKPGDNHKLLAHGVGTWTYAVKMWMSMDTNAAPNQSSGTAVVREIMGGRYFVGDHTGRFDMPGPDGKLTSMDFKGMSLEGYDNARKMFVASWIDNMGTGIMSMEGTYDAKNKVLTYRGEYTPMPGMKTKVREVIKLIDPDHRLLEWYEDRGGIDFKTMEIAYTRKT